MTRLTVQRVLGLLWLLDGLLQLKPAMFTEEFTKQVILPTAAGEPGWLASTIQWAAELTTPHIAFWNTVFALIQIGLGVGLLLNRQVRWVLGASFAWTLLVWWLGEGLGQVLTGQTLLLSGAPGAVLLYGLIGVAVWPENRSDTVTEAESPGREPWSARGRTFARYAIGLLWLLGSGLHFQQAFLNSKGLLDAVAVPWVSQLIGSHALGVSLVLALLEFVLGVLFIFKVQLKTAIWASVVLSALYWWVGQSFGQVFTPLATDFNSGLLLIVLSLTVNPEVFHLQVRRSWQMRSNPSS